MALYLCVVMAKKKKDLSTEEKIKEAASQVFQKKGFAGTRTRDIADEAGLNLALINYYFRSKQKLFEIIMEEKLRSFFMNFIPLILSDSSTLEEKVKLLAKNYITLLLENPDLPVFVMNAIHNDPKHFANIVRGAEMIQHAPLVAQLKKINPKMKFEHFFMNIMALTIFPFIMRPAISIISNPIGKDFESLMKERIELIPTWIDAMVKAK